MDDVPFNGSAQPRSGEGLAFNHAEAQGGFNEASISAELETISEPQPVELDFSPEHSARAFDQGEDLEVSPKQGGLAQAQRYQASAAALTMDDEAAKALLDEQFNSRPQPLAAHQEPIFDAAAALAPRHAKHQDVEEEVQEAKPAAEQAPEPVAAESVTTEEAAPEAQPAAQEAAAEAQPAERSVEKAPEPESDEISASLDAILNSNGSGEFLGAMEEQDDGRPRSKSRKQERSSKRGKKAKDVAEVSAAPAAASTAAEAVPC